MRQEIFKEIFESLIENMKAYISQKENTHCAKFNLKEKMLTQTISNPPQINPKILIYFGVQLLIKM